MNWLLKYRPLYEGEGAGGAGGGTPPAGGNGAGGTGGGNEFTPAPAPWTAAGENLFTVGDKAQPWWESIPEAPVRELMSQKQYKNPAVLATAYHNLNKEFSADNRTAIPDFATAKPEDLNNFYAKKGRPATADLYDAKIFAPGEGEQTTEAMQKLGRDMAYELGLNPHEAAKMTGKWNTAMKEMKAAETQAAKQANDAALDKVLSKWGEEADAMIADGKRAYQALGMDKELSENIEKSMGSAAMAELFARLGKMGREGKFMSNGGGGGGGNNPADVNSMTPDFAAQEINRLRADATFSAAFSNANADGHKEAVERMNALYARAGDKVGI